MAKLATMKFRGASGREYSFDVYPFDTTWRDNVAAVYFVTRRYQKEDGKYYHDEIYVGETTNLKERFQKHHKIECFYRKNANCICILLESNLDTRLSIEADLISAHNPPCNV